MKRLTEMVRQNRVTVTVATVVFLLAGIVIWNFHNPRADPRIESIRKAGYPVTLAELDAWYPAVPDAENAALVYTNAFARLVPKGDDDGTPSLGERLGDIRLPPRGQVLPVEAQAELSNLVASNQPALHLLYAAQALKRSRYPIDPKRGILKSPPYLEKARQAVQLLAAVSLLHSANSENEKAAQSLLAAGRVADSLALDSEYVRIVCWNIIMSRLERVINASNLTDGELVSLQAMLTEGEQPQSLARGLAGDRVAILALFADPKLIRWIGVPDELVPDKKELDREEPIGWIATISLLKATGFFQKDRAFYLDVMATNIAAAELTYPERFKVSQQTAAMAQTPPSRFCIVSSGMGRGLVRTFAKDADHAARIRVAQTALAVERFRRAHSESLPASLDELVPTYLKAVPLDPIDGQMLRFKKLAKGYVIYSLGSDGKDDGGVEPTSSFARPNVPRDITFIMER